MMKEKIKEKKRDNKKNLGSTELSRKRCDHGYEIEIISQKKTQEQKFGYQFLTSQMRT